MILPVCLLDPLLYISGLLLSNHTGPHFPSIFIAHMDGCVSALQTLADPNSTIDVLRTIEIANSNIIMLCMRIEMWIWPWSATPKA